jgi:hypothetical protein
MGLALVGGVRDWRVHVGNVAEDRSCRRAPAERFEMFGAFAEAVKCAAEVLVCIAQHDVQEALPFGRDFEIALQLSCRCVFSALFPSRGED